MSERVLGLDVSRYQEFVDWNTAKIKGVVFAYIRAGVVYQNLNGGYAKDVRMDQHTAGAEESGIPYGYYWFYAPHINPVEQANAFASYIGSKNWELPPVIDVEYNGTGEGYLGKTSYANSVHTFVDTLKVLTESTPVIYTRGSFWNSFVGAKPALGSYPLWVARYAELRHPWSDGRYKPREWSDWSFWQFSADGNRRASEFGVSGSRDIDLNYFNGSLSDLFGFIKQYGRMLRDSPTIPDGKIHPDPEQYELLVDTVNKLNSRVYELESRAASLKEILKSLVDVY